MAVVKMMVAFLGMVAVAYALPPQEEALPAKPAGPNQKEGGNIRERRADWTSSMGPGNLTGKFVCFPRARTHAHSPRALSNFRVPP